MQRSVTTSWEREVVVCWGGRRSLVDATVQAVTFDCWRTRRHQTLAANVVMIQVKDSCAGCMTGLEHGAAVLAEVATGDERTSTCSDPVY